MKKQSKLQQTFDLQKILLPIFILIFAISLTSCNSKTESKNHSSKSTSDSVSLAEKPNTSLDSIVLFLLEVSAKDFHDHQPPGLIKFRNVQVRNLINPNAENLYMICGQFLAKDEWISFATIKTFGYEQWIGNQSLGFCQDSKPISYKTNDLSLALKSRVDSLQNVKENNK